MRAYSAKDKAIKKLLGREPSRRYKADTVLARLTEAYPGQMHVIAEHISRRLEESGGDDCPSGRRLAICLEAELLALRNILLGEVVTQGVIDEAGDENKHLRTVLRITDQVSRLANIIGLDPPAEDEKNAPIDVHKLWNLDKDDENE